VEVADVLRASQVITALDLHNIADAAIHGPTFINALMCVFFLFLEGFLNFRPPSCAYFFFFKMIFKSPTSSCYP
jgi:hypothetical protein